jgi:hypothetical protein
MWLFVITVRSQRRACCRTGGRDTVFLKAPHGIRGDRYDVTASAALDIDRQAVLASAKVAKIGLILVPHNVTGDRSAGILVVNALQSRRCATEAATSGNFVACAIHSDMRNNHCGTRNKNLCGDGIIENIYTVLDQPV